MKSNRSKAVKRLWKMWANGGESLRQYAKRIAEDKDYTPHCTLIRAWWKVKK